MPKKKQAAARAAPQAKSVEVRVDDIIKMRSYLDNYFSILQQKINEITDYSGALGYLFQKRKDQSLTQIRQISSLVLDIHLAQFGRSQQEASTKKELQEQLDAVKTAVLAEYPTTREETRVKLEEAETQEQSDNHNNIAAAKRAPTIKNRFEFVSLSLFTRQNTIQGTDIKEGIPPKPSWWQRAKATVSGWFSRATPTTDAAQRATPTAVAAPAVIPTDSDASSQRSRSNSSTAAILVASPPPSGTGSPSGTPRPPSPASSADSGHGAADPQPAAPASSAEPGNTHPPIVGGPFGIRCYRP
jgi:hypothetical protein